MATIIRVTDKRGRGVYNSYTMSKVGLSGSARSNRPMPFEDGLHGHGADEHHRFGFKDAYAMRAWFDDDIPYLAEHTQVRIYEVKDSHVIHGRKQLTFDRRKAKLIGIKNITEI